MSEETKKHFTTLLIEAQSLIENSDEVNHDLSELENLIEIITIYKYKKHSFESGVPWKSERLNLDSNKDHGITIVTRFRLEE